MKTISYYQIEEINYEILDLLGIEKDFEMSVIDFIDKYRDSHEDKSEIINLLLRLDFVTIKDMRLFAVYCAREFIKDAEINDSLAINACSTVEKYATEFQCPTNDELFDIKSSVYMINDNFAMNPVYWACSASPSKASIMAGSSLADYLATKKDPSRGAKWSIVFNKARSEQIDKLKEILKG